MNDRKFVITGLFLISSAAFVFIRQQWFGGIGIPSVFGNVLVNTILFFGITILKLGIKKDKYRRDISEI